LIHYAGQINQPPTTNHQPPTTDCYDRDFQANEF
jgi:hypothetical protein